MSSSTFNSESSAPPSGRKIPWGLIIALFATLMIETFLSRGEAARGLLKRRFYPPDRVPILEESIVQWQVFHATRPRRRQSVLLLGDSSCLMGLRPKIIMRETGLKTWNLGTLSWLGVPGHLQILKTYLEHQPPPSLLVYHVTLNPFGRGRHLELSKKYQERLLRWLGGDDAPSAWLPSLRYRRDFRSLLAPDELQNEFQDANREPFPTDREVRRILLEERGSMEEPRLRPWTTPPTLDFHPYDGAEEELGTFFEFCQSQGMEVLVMMNPLPDLVETPHNLATFAAFEAFLKRAAAPYEGVSLAQPLARFYGNPGTCCSGLAHLLEAGARRNSEELAGWIRDREFAKSN